MEKTKSEKNPDLNSFDWPKDAENYTFESKKISCDKHVFTETKRSNEVKCKMCPIGYILSPEMYIKNGKIYFEDKLVI